MAQKRRRLSRSAEFERVYRQGRSKANRYLVLYAPQLSGIVRARVNLVQDLDATAGGGSSGKNFCTLWRHDGVRAKGCQS